MKFNWREDPDAETILRDVVGVSWEYCEISLGSVDWESSAQNCARLSNPLNTEKIEDYATGFSRGDVFPAVVVEETKVGFVLLGGNQRCNAVKQVAAKESVSLDDVWVDAYVVQPLVTCEREIIIRSLNSRHGWGSEKAERIEHAVYLVKHFGLQASTVAKACMVSESIIKERIKSEETRAALVKQGVDASRATVSMLSQLGKIQDDEPRRRVADIALKNNLTVEHVKNIADAVVKLGSEARKLKAVSEWSNSIERTKVVSSASGMKKPRREKFFRMLSDFSRFLETGNDGSAFKCLDEVQCDKDIDGDKVRVLVASITNRLRCICEAQ